MFDSTGITHTARRNNYLAVFVKVDCFGIVTCDRGFQSREHQWVDALIYKCHGFFIKTVINMFIKNGCRFVCKRTVHINFEIIMSVNASFFFDLTDEIKHLLRTSYRK